MNMKEQAKYAKHSKRDKIWLYGENMLIFNLKIGSNSKEKSQINKLW